MPSTPQTVDGLLNVLDPLPHPQRMRELARRVRDMERPLRPLLEELDGLGPYERGIAVVAASVARDAEWIAVRIADPDPYVRGHALRVADSLQVPDSSYESALADAPEVVRRELLRAVVAGRRTALADRMTDRLRREWGDTEAARLLPACSPQTAARLLPELFHAVTGWRTLAKRHPGTLLDVAEREVAALPEALRDAWWSRYAVALAAVTPAEPLRVLDLLERLGPAVLPHELRDHVSAFASADPVRVVRLLLTPAWSGALGAHSMSGTVLRALARSGAPELVAYGRALAPNGGLPPLLRAMPPARRHSFCSEVHEGRGPANMDAALLEALPRGAAAHEARAMADVLREKGGRWNALLRVECHLPVAEVRDRLVEATRRPAAEDRAEAWQLLIRNAVRSGDPAAVASALAEMGRLRNEQDPVRSAALDELARARPALFTEDAEPHLDRVAVDAVQAPDSSPDTRRHLSRLAVSVLREHAANGQRDLVNWALRTLVRISGNTGGTGRDLLGRLDQTLRRGQEHQVYEALRPWIEAGAEKADYGLSFALARAVGRRAAGMPELQELLWQAIRYGSDTTAREAIVLWLEPPATRDERVARVLSLEPSAGVLPPVRRAVVRRRTDLLDPLLAVTPPYGRFLTKEAWWTLRVDRNVRRWVPRQQQAVARQLTASAEDTGLTLYQRAVAVGQSALVPGMGAGLVRRWTGSTEVVLAEAALAALARTDCPADALPELLAHAGDDRARVTVYVAAQASRYAPPSLLAEQLRALLLTPDAKVTSRKEAARLAAVRLPVPRAAELLTEAYAWPATHADVRSACVAFAEPLLAEETVWAMLADAAGAGPVPRAAVLHVAPLDLPAPHRERYARLVRDVCDTDDPETASLAFDALARWAPWSPDAPTVLADATADLSERVSWRAAASGLVTAAVGSARGAEGLRRALRTLAESDIGADAEGRRDRPARRRVEHLVRQLAHHARPAPHPVRPAALAASELLAAYDDFVPQAAAIAAFHLDLDTGPEHLHRLAALTESRPALADRTARAVGERLRGRAHEGDPGTLLPVARGLAAHGGHAQGLLAVALTGALGARTGWPGPWRDQLRALRRHPVPDVRDAALAEVTAYE
ncbi:hypothetical protein [Streptomyces acidicola]|uniref:hypothetical protein n=1 Tax=Streptomyces acidicola TaxID=2596892 RepID=UPI0037FF2A2E